MLKWWRLRVTSLRKKTLFFFRTSKILNVLYLRAPKELEAHIHRFQSTHEYYELTKFQRQTPPQSEDRANFVIFWNPILKIALSTVGEPTLKVVCPVLSHREKKKLFFFPNFLENLQINVQNVQNLWKFVWRFSKKIFKNPKKKINIISQKMYLKIFPVFFWKSSNKFPKFSKSLKIYLKIFKKIQKTFWKFWKFWKFIWKFPKKIFKNPKKSTRSWGDSTGLTTFKLV